jgi:anti-anti-sigma factor
MPAGGGTSQTSVADDMGVRSQLAQWVNAGAVLLTLSVFSALIGLLPQAVLAAVILVAALAMIKPANFRAIARVRRDELMWALVTAAGVVLIGTLEGIAIAVVVSMLTLVYQANHPPVYPVAWSRGQNVFRRQGEDAADETFPGLLLLRTEGRLTFANADTVADKMRSLVAQWQPRVIVLECSAIPDIEYTALIMLTDAERQLRERGVELWLAGVNPDLRRILDRSELGQNLGSERIHFNLYQALAARHARPQTAPL